MVSHCHIISVFYYRSYFHIYIHTRYIYDVDEEANPVSLKTIGYTTLKEAIDYKR